MVNLLTNRDVVWKNQATCPRPTYFISDVYICCRKLLSTQPAPASIANSSISYFKKGIYFQSWSSTGLVGSKTGPMRFQIGPIGSPIVSRMSQECSQLSIFLETIKIQQNSHHKKEQSWLTALRCSGWLYVTTPETAYRLAQAAQGPSLFWIDDVWVRNSCHYSACDYLRT